MYLFVFGQKKLGVFSIIFQNFSKTVKTNNRKINDKLYIVNIVNIIF